jgi:hypothetical protein
MVSLLLACAVLVGGCVVASRGDPQVEPMARPADKAALADGRYAVVYIRSDYTTGRQSIIWQSLTDGQPRVLYQTDGFATVPDDFGLLPSPDGKWLLVWYWRHQAGQTGMTEWLLLSVPDAETLPVGETEGRPRLLPFWRDRSHVLLLGEITLVGDTDIAEFDVDSRQLSRPLPQPRWAAPVGLPAIGQWVNRARLEVYAQRFYSNALGTLQVASESGYLQNAPELWVTWWQHPEPPEYVLLSPLGIPTLGVLREGALANRLYPEFAVSPDGRFLAYAWVCEKAEGVYGRVDLYDVKISSRTNVASAIWPGWKYFSGDWQQLLPGKVQPHFKNVRWTPDSRYLSYTAYGVSKDSPYVAVVEGGTGKEILHIRDAISGFVIPSTESAGGTMSRPRDEPIR